jgi:RNA polymerase sigma-70 factor (ECF subfamily)
MSSIVGPFHRNVALIAHKSATCKPPTLTIPPTLLGSSDCQTGNRRKPREKRHTVQDTRRIELEQLIARVASGDREAFDRLYATTSARLYALCLSILKDRPESEETLKNVFVRIWRDASRFQAGSLSPSTWLTTIARNTAIDRLRSHDTITDTAETPGANRPPLKLAVSAVNAEFFGLDAAEAQAVQWAYLDGATYADLSAAEGIPRTVMRTKLRQALAKMINEDGATLPDQIIAGELTLGVLPDDEAQAAVQRLSTEPEFAQGVRDWQDRLAVLAEGLTPVMPPARARQRMREELGHGVPPLSVDPTDQDRGGNRAWLLLLAILVIAALAFFWF